MRIAIGLLACIGAGALTTTLADPPSEATPAATSTPAAAAPAATDPNAKPAATATGAAAAAKTAVAKAELDRDTRHFLAIGYKPEMHRGEQIYCRKETDLGSRLTQVKNCGTIEELKLQEQGTRNGLSETQRKQVGIQTH